MAQAIEKLNRWIEGQRIGLASYAYCVTPGRFREQDDVLALLRGYLIEVPNLRGWGEAQFLRQLTPSVLSLLMRAIRTRGGLEKVARPAEDAHTWLVGAGDPAPFVKAQIWAHHLLLGSSSASQLSRLGKSLFGSIEASAVGEASWRHLVRDASFLRSLEQAIEVLRAPQSRTSDRLEAVTGIDLTGVGVPPPSWHQVENALIEYQMGWPLLVAVMGEGQSGIGLSLPVSVDVDLDGTFGPAPKQSEGILDLRAWQKSLTRCAEVGRQLWRSKRGNHGDFRDMVARCSVHFDFSIAQEIGQGLYAIGYRIPVDGGSADTYLAQLVLSRLLGRHGLMGSAVTGSIGERMVDAVDQAPLLNYHFSPPGGIREKLDYAFSTRTYERIVLPYGTEEDVSEAIALARDESTSAAPQSSEVIFAHNQQVVADSVQGGQWRQGQYVRCPDLVWGIHGSHRHGRPSLLPAAHPEVANVLALLAANQDDAILELHDVRPVAVASALWQIHQLRETLLPRVPPMLSWAFVRLLENDQDSLFWRLLWNVTGASIPAYEDFLHSVTRAQVASKVADVVNRFEPTPEWPSHRAPDILVLVRSHLLERQQEFCENPLSRPFMVWPVLQELRAKQMLTGPFDEAYRQLIGKTRIILIPNEIEELATEPIPEDLDRLHNSALHILSVFEWGFTLRTASLLLSEHRGFENIRFREQVILPLEQRGLLRTAEGRHHIPGPVLRQLRLEVEREGPAVLAGRHFRAGVALASFASRSDQPALALDVAFSPEHITEAERHLTLAIRYAREGRDQATGVAAKAALNRITRYLRTPHWGTVSGFLQSGELLHDAHEMAEELISIERASGLPVHPQHLVLAGRAAAMVSKQEAGDSTGDTGRSLRAIAEEHFQQALEGCAEFPTEEGVNRIITLTDYVSYLAKFDPERHSEIDRYTEEALGLLGNGVSGRAARGDWFELIADRERDHVRAYRIYRSGTQATPAWAQLWLKALGAAVLTQTPELVSDCEAALGADVPKGAPSGTPSELADRIQSHLLRLLNVTKGSYQRERSTGAAHVRDRWEAALSRIGANRRDDRRVQDALAEMRQPRKR